MATAAESHAAQTIVHRLFADVYADVAERTAATGFARGPADAVVPFDSTDIGKAVWQIDDGSGNHSFWVLIDDSPVTWLQFDGIGWLTALAAHVAASDPHTGYQKESEKGAASGYASLDGAGLIPITQLPAIAINDTFPVVSQAAMLALTAQRGDVALRTDFSPALAFILSTDDPGTLADWIQITFSGGVPGSHASTHQNGGSDELDVTGLSGLLADPQVPLIQFRSSFVVFIFGDGKNTSSIEANLEEVYNYLPAGTIVRWRIDADASCSVVIDLLKSTADPPSYSSITAAATPALVTDERNESSSLGTWTTGIALGNALMARITALTGGTPKRLTLTVELLKS